jgi:hypothetical protein
MRRIGYSHIRPSERDTQFSTMLFLWTRSPVDHFDGNAWLLVRNGAIGASLARAHAIPSDF